MKIRLSRYRIKAKKRRYSPIVLNLDLNPQNLLRIYLIHCIIKLKERMSDQMLKLISMQANNMDQDLFNGINTCSISNEQILPYDTQNEKNQHYSQIANFETKNSLPNSQISQSNDAYTLGQKSGNNKAKRKIKASTWNKKMGLMTQHPGLQKKKYIKKKKNPNSQIQPVAQYPTKNFLQNFRGAHLSFLQLKLPEKYLNKFEVYLQVKTKNFINMDNYKELYSVPEFEIVFDEMFRTKYLYRHLMQSRSGFKAKIDHHRKISTFQSAFRTKTFNRIN